MQYDVVVIGGGPGGYVAAIRAAQLGGRVALVERAQLGGVCLNRGCIPTKTLLKSAEQWRQLQHCAEFGLRAERLGFDFTQVMERKNKVVDQLRSGIEQLVKSNAIELISGAAQLRGDGQVAVAQGGGQAKVISGKRIIIASGSEAQALPVPGGELPGVINSDAILALTEVPQNMAVIGAGAVGIEFAAIFQAFGCNVTVIEMQPAILADIDSDLVKRMGVILRKQGLKFLTETKVTGFTAAEKGIALAFENAKGAQELTVEKVLVAVGRRPVVAGLGLEAAGIMHRQQGISVNERMETNLAGVYAIGDVTGRSMLAHVASAQGLVAAENAMGGTAVMDYRAVPACIFTTPEIATVGLSEEQAKSQGKAIKVSRFNFAANGKAVAMGESDGLVKIIADANDDQVIGMHILGPHASDLIMEGAIAIRNGLRAQELGHTIHPHPSLSEAVMEATHGIFGEMVHQVKKTSRI